MLSRIWSLCYVLALALSFVQALPQLGSSSQPGPRKANVPPNGIVGYMKVLPTGQDMIPWDGWLDSSGQVTTQKCDRSKFQVNNGMPDSPFIPHSSSFVFPLLHSFLKGRDLN